jgi:hypothetical protein
MWLRAKNSAAALATLQLINTIDELPYDVVARTMGVMNDTINYISYISQQKIISALMEVGEGAYAYRPTRLRSPRLVQALRGGVTPFRCFLGLFFVLLEARDVLVGEEEAVAGEGGCAEELEDGFCDGDGRVVHDG